MDSKSARGALFSLLLAAIQPAWSSGDEPVELDEIRVTGMSQELGLRAIKVALDTPRSSRSEDLDKMVCWFDKGPGSFMTHLYCATNRVLRDSADFTSGAMGGTPKGASPAALDRIQHWRVNRGELEARLERLGPPELNQEIVARALQGGPLPKNVPSKNELDRFIQALSRVREIGAEYDPRIAEARGEERHALIARSDRLMAEAIEESGLTVDRYNEISGLVSQYESLRTQIRDRIASRQ